MSAQLESSRAELIQNDYALVRQPRSSAAAILDARSPIRIMHVVDRLDVGGTEIALMKLIHSLDPRIFEHSICTVRGMASRFCSWSSDVVVRQAGRSTGSFQFNLVRLCRLMKAVRPTIVHSRNWGGIEAILAARLAGIPVIIHSEHGYDLNMQRGLPLRQSLYRNFSYRYATAVFTVTEELRRYHSAQARCSPRRIAVLYNGVDTEKFKGRPHLRSALRQQLGLSPDCLVIGFVGRMIALKDVLTLLRAAEKIASELPDFQILLIGEGPERARLEEYVGGSPSLPGRVTFARNRPDIADLLNAIDVFVLPSLAEGMSNTLLEAFATGIPALATNVGGNPEIVEDGMSGYLFPPGDVSALANRLLVLLRDDRLRKAVGAAARNRAVANFSLDGMLSRYTDLYLGLAREHGIRVVA
ncbi:MAG: glycosyltransferase [Candidatus Korobacteraceae bacterium]